MRVWIVQPGDLSDSMNDFLAVPFLMSKGWSDLPNWPLRSWLIFLVALVGLFIVIWQVIRLVARVNEDSDPAEADHEMLLVLSELHREGDLTKEEFRSIKGQIVGRLRVTESGRMGVKAGGNSAVLSGLPDEGDVRPILQNEALKIPYQNSSEICADKVQSGDSPNSDPVKLVEPKSSNGEMNAPNVPASE